MCGMSLSLNFNFLLPAMPQPAPMMRPPRSHMGPRPMRGAGPPPPWAHPPHPGMGGMRPRFNSYGAPPHQQQQPTQQTDAGM